MGGVLCGPCGVLPVMVKIVVAILRLPLCVDPFGVAVVSVILVQVAINVLLPLRMIYVVFKAYKRYRRRSIVMRFYAPIIMFILTCITIHWVQSKLSNICPHKESLQQSLGVFIFLSMIFYKRYSRRFTIRADSSVHSNAMVDPYKLTRSGQSYGLRYSDAEFDEYFKSGKSHVFNYVYDDPYSNDNDDEDYSPTNSVKNHKNNSQLKNNKSQMNQKKNKSQMNQKKNKSQMNQKKKKKSQMNNSCSEICIRPSNSHPPGYKGYPPSNYPPSNWNYIRDMPLRSYPSRHSYFSDHGYIPHTNADLSSFGDY